MGQRVGRCYTCVEELRSQARVAIDAGEQLIATLSAERDRLRAALAALVGTDGRAELEQLEAVMRLMPAPAQDKAVTIDAIHALIATCPETTLPKSTEAIV